MKENYVQSIFCKRKVILIPVKVKFNTNFEIDVINVIVTKLLYYRPAHRSFQFQFFFTHRFLDH